MLFQINIIITLILVIVLRKRYVKQFKCLIQSKIIAIGVVAIIKKYLRHLNNCNKEIETTCIDI